MLIIFIVTLIILLLRSYKMSAGDKLNNGYDIYMDVIHVLLWWNSALIGYFINHERETDL
jgi:hypothetical protein